MTPTTSIEQPTATQPTTTSASNKAQGKPETELRAAARRHGLTMQELADRMGVSTRYLSMLSTGKVSWSQAMKEKAMAVLGEVPGQGVVYRQGGLVSGESTCIRERAREMGMSMNQLAEKAGVSSGYLSDVSRGRRNMGVKVQQRVEALLQAPAQAAPAQKPRVDCRALWDRMDAHGISQNEAARRAGISAGHLSLVMSGRRTPSGDVLRRLHEVLFAPSPAERVMPVNLKVLAWKKGKRNGVVVKGAGGPRSDGKPGDGTIRVGGRAPWGAEVQFAYATGYDGHGRVFVNHLVRESGCFALLEKPEAADA
ncbi:MAG: helix-turn-helix domain-containing protein [Chloroflexota bacterium]|nr:helix-turn-helix domain-containing protein [Chloroflexota bacterium]